MFEYYVTHGSRDHFTEEMDGSSADGLKPLSVSSESTSSASMVLKDGEKLWQLCMGRWGVIVI
jgi:hypothetical protein